jgi:hypothetical protein
MANRVKSPYWVDLPPSQWPLSAKSAYSTVLEWNRRLNEMKRKGDDVASMHREG